MTATVRAAFATIKRNAARSPRGVVVRIEVRRRIAWPEGQPDGDAGHATATWRAMRGLRPAGGPGLRWRWCLRVFANDAADHNHLLVDVLLGTWLSVTT